jgi:hypothetical protein
MPAIRYYRKGHMYHGWYWQTVYQAKGSHANWMYQLDKHHNQVRIRITLKSNSDYSEQHILDNLEVKGWACDKPVEKVVKCKTTSCSYSSGHTHVYSMMLNDKMAPVAWILAGSRAEQARADLKAAVR